MDEGKDQAKIVREVGNEIATDDDTITPVPAQQPDAGRLRPEEKKACQQETLRQQLQKLISHKLATNNGDLDHAGLLALETLSKMAPEGGDVEAVGGGGGGCGAGGLDSGTKVNSKRILPPGIESLPKFSGKDPASVSDILNRFHSLVVAALPGSSPGAINKALNRDVVFVLEGSALKFFNSLKAGQIEWEPTPPQQEATPSSAEGGGGGAQQQQQQQPGKKTPFRPPSTWEEVCNAFHDHYLPAEGIERTSETLFSLSQAAGESVPSLAQRQMGLTHHLSRLIDAHGGQTTFLDAVMIRLFERALRADLRRLQHAEPPCPTFQESVDRAERNALSLENKRNKNGNIQKNNSSVLGVTKGVVQDWVGVKGAAHVRSPVRGSVAMSAAGEDVAAAVAEGFLRGDTNGSGRNYRSEESNHDASHKTGFPISDDVSRSTFALQDGSEEGKEDDGGGVEEDGSRAFGKPIKKSRRSHKRVRDWQDNNHRSSQHHPRPPHQRRQVDPGSIPPCRVAQCKTINRQFHCSNDCYYHPIFGERNSSRARKNRHPNNVESEDPSDQPY